jgi:phenylacetate-CoA ligase
VSGEEVGRLIFSNKIREAITVQNYEIGDIGQWVFGQCECGRKHRRFRLLGRQGEVFRVGGSFINYQRLQSQIELTLQIIIQKKQGLDHLVFVTNQMMDVSLLINSYPDLKEIVVEKVLTWEHQVRDQLIYTHAGKLKKVIDERVL